jgi:hypothetical protein
MSIYELDQSPKLPVHKNTREVSWSGLEPRVDRVQHVHLRVLILLEMSFNPLKTKLVYILFQNSVRTSKRTPNFAITKIKWLILFKDSFITNQWYRSTIRFWQHKTYKTK